MRITRKRAMVALVAIALWCVVVVGCSEGQWNFF